MRAAGRRLAIAAVVGCALGGPLAMGATADTELTLSLAVTRAAWYWDRPGTPAEVPPEVTAQLSGVPGGSVAVAWRGGAEGAPEKETYLAFDVVGLGTDSEVLQLTVRAPVNAAGRNEQPTSGPAQLIGCLPKASWAAVEGAAFADKPQDDCSAHVKATYDAATTSYLFTVTALVSTWRRDNVGLAIRPPLDMALPAEPYQVVFDPKAVTATATIVEEAAPPPTVPTQPSGPVISQPRDTPPLTSGFVPPRDPAVTDPPPQPTTEPGRAPVPEVEIVTPVATEVLGPDGLPVGTLSLVLLGVLVLVGVVAWATGDAAYALDTVRAWAGHRGAAPPR